MQPGICRELGEAPQDGSGVNMATAKLHPGKAKNIPMRTTSQWFGCRHLYIATIHAWWTDEIKDAIERKKRAYKKILQRNLPEGVKARRKYEYKEWKKKVRELIEESKRRVDEEFGKKLSFCENKKLFWKEVKKGEGWREGWGCKNEGRG